METYAWAQEFRAIVTVCEAEGIILEMNGRRKLIHQAPWYRDGQFAGFTEIVLSVPDTMSHFVRVGTT